MIQWKIINNFFLKRDFFKNIITLIAGTGFSQLLTVACSPLLTRIYSPLEFGKLAFFMSTCAILSILSTGRYELAIMLPKTHKKAFNILLLTSFLAFFINFIILLFFLFFGDFLLKLFNNPINLSTLLYIPIGTFFLACFQALNLWLTRSKKFKALSTIRIAQSLITIVVSLALGILGSKAFGLITSFIVGSAVSIIPLIYIILKERSLFSIKYILSGAKKYISYPAVMMITAFMDTFAMQAPVFFITNYFSSLVVGAYSLAFRIVTAPIGIISGAIGQVYFQKITSMVNVTQNSIYPTLIKTAKILLVISLALFLPFFGFGRYIFGFIFGANWVNAGEYVEIISIAMMVRFVVSPLSTVFISTSNLKIAALWQTTYFFTTIVMFLFGRNLEIKKLLSLYAIHEIILYTIYFGLIVFVSKKFDKKILCVD